MIYHSVAEGMPHKVSFTPGAGGDADSVDRTKVGIAHKMVLPADVHHWMHGGAGKLKDMENYPKRWLHAQSKVSLWWEYVTVCTRFGNPSNACSFTTFTRVLDDQPWIGFMHKTEMARCTVCDQLRKRCDGQCR